MHNVLRQLQDKFELVFDGQTTLKTQCIAMLTTFPQMCVLGSSSAYLALFSLEVKVLQDSNKHVYFLEFVIDVFGQLLLNIVATNRDDYNVNSLMSTKMRIPILVFPSHRFQIAVMKTISKESNTFVQVDQMMKEL